MSEAIILFDLDGTLINAKVPILKSINHAFAREGLPLPDSDYASSLIGLPLRGIFRELGGPEEKMDALVEGYRDLFLREGASLTTLMEGGRDAVLEANSFASLGVVTTRVSSYSRILLEKLLGEDVNHFKTIIGFESVTNPKPHPEPVELAIRNIRGEGSDHSRTWMIGDTPLDLDAAKAAGAGAVGVRNGHGDLSAYEDDPNVILVDDVLSGVRKIQQILAGERDAQRVS